MPNSTATNLPHSRYSPAGAPERFYLRTSPLNRCLMVRMVCMKLGVGIDPRLGLSRMQQRQLVQQAATLGYDSLWTPAGVAARSIFQTCREWWEATADVVAEGLSVGTSVIPFPGWTVPSLGAESATLNDVTGGKFKLGIGLGAYPSPVFVRQLGLPTIPPLAYTRDYLHTLRALFRGETVDYAGKGLSLHG